jgi:hypothetical protein
MVGGGAAGGVIGLFGAWCYLRLGTASGTGTAYFKIFAVFPINNSLHCEGVVDSLLYVSASVIKEDATLKVKC